jgi:hypothetical protein
MLHRQVWACVAMALLLAAPQLLQAQGSAPGGLQGLVQTLSAIGLEQGIIEPGVFSHGHTLEDSLGGRHYMLIHELQIGYGVSRNLELGVSMPVRAWRATIQDTLGSQPDAMLGFGDLVASAKVRVPLPGNRLVLSGVGRVAFPTGSKSRGFTTGTTDYEAGGLLTLDYSDLESFVPTRLHLNAIYRWNRNESAGIGMVPLDRVRDGGFWPPAYPSSVGQTQRWNDHLLLRAGIDFKTRLLVLFTEFSAGRTVPTEKSA